MSIACDREGTFRALITEYALLKGKNTKSVGVSITANLEEFRDEDGSWAPWAEYDMVLTGQVNVVKGDGTLNQLGIESLVKHAGWDGDFASIVNGTWQPTRCQLTSSANLEKYGGGFRVNYVKGYDAEPGGGGNVSPEELKQLQTQYGSQFRAVVASAKKNAAPTTGKPAIPPKAAPKTTTATTPTAMPKSVDEFNAANAKLAQDATEEIPFAWIGFILAAGLSMGSALC